MARTLFSQIKKWKLVLYGSGILISAAFLIFTNYLVSDLSKEQTNKVKAIAKAFQDASNPTIEDKGEILHIIQSDTVTPIIVTDEKFHVMRLKNIDTSKAHDSSYLYDELTSMKYYHEPIPIKMDTVIYGYVFYKEQPTLTLLRYFPYVQLFLISMFLIIAFVIFNTSRRYEQNMVWVGLAKETAHQIGTPLSSMIGWIEYLKTIENVPEEVVTELTKDVSRLEVITERFSKIGSTPELTDMNIADVLSETIDYLRRRISKNVNLFLDERSDMTVRAGINKNLFSWVIENLTKNAVDAMTGSGEINIRTWQTPKSIYIEVKDTGKGIPHSNFKRVFEPGYTTRKRGWGLGLSLTKRIIENYHKGEIFVKDSEIGKGTTFRIRLNSSAGI